MTNILDNTIGVLICIFCLLYVEKQLAAKGRKEYISGNYYIIERVTATIEILHKPSTDPEIHLNGNSEVVRKSSCEEGSQHSEDGHKTELV